MLEDDEIPEFVCGAGASGGRRKPTARSARNEEDFDLQKIGYPKGPFRLMNISIRKWSCGLIWQRGLDGFKDAMSSASLA